MSSVRSINYTKKDFDGFKEQLLEFAKNYFPDSYSDFSVPSPGTMFLEMAAYVGDILAFYQDVQVQETFIQYAKNPANLYAIAYMMGYRPKVTTVSEVELVFQQNVGAVQEEDGTWHPDWSQTYKIGAYSEFKSAAVNNISFLLRDDVDFSFSSSYDPTDMYVGALDDNGNPLYYTLIKKGVAFSGEIREQSFSFGEYEKFKTITLRDDKIVGVISIDDVENGEKWEEVPTLGQDTIFVPEKVQDMDVANEKGTSYILRLKKVDRRFTTRFNAKGQLEIQFGAGMYAEDSDEENFLPNPISLKETTQDIVEKFDVAYDPSNFLFSKSYGLAPINKTLNVRYIVGGGLIANVPAETIVEFKVLNLSSTVSGNAVDLGNLNIELEDGTSVAALSFYNPKPAAGGRSGDTLDEIRENSLRAFAEQKRIVTLNDYNVRALSMPQKFGNISKVHATNEPLTDVELSALTRNPLAITLYVLSQDIEGHLIPTSDLVKRNLRTYLSEYMMITDAIDIKDAFVIDIGINYDVVLRPGAQTGEVLLNCNKAIQDYMRIENRSINEPINLSDLYTMLDRVEGVQTVRNISLVNLSGEYEDGRKYSEYTYSIAVALRNNVLYPSYDPCIFEVRYPDVDILGRAVTL